MHDFRIPWRPLYDALYNELFPHPNKLSRHSLNLSPVFLNVAEAAQRFFHPDEADEMLEVILPQFDPSMDSILATQLFLVHFLPIAPCEKWLPLIFRLWYGLNSGLWDDQASDLIGQLAMAHIEPSRSDPTLLARIPRGPTNTPEEQAKNPSLRKAERQHRHRILDYEGKVVEDNDGLNYWVDPEQLPAEEDNGDPNWRGMRRDVGIFTDEQFEFIMSKCLRSLNVPVGGSLASQNSMSITAADARASKKILDAKKPIDRTQSLAEVIIYSMSEDAPVAPFGTTGAPTRAATPAPGLSSHHASNGNPLSRVRNGDVAMSRTDSTDSLKAAGESIERSKKYLAGSKALDHLSQLITSCETFFHPSNAGPWSSFLTVFLSHLTSNFVQRWKQEEEPSCKTPVEWRLTPEIKRSFVLTLRPVALSAMFNKDMESAQPAISTLRRLALLEPDLIMPAIMERAVPSLQGLEETQRTASVTFALAAVAQPLSGRAVWRFGGMYVADILTLLLPGIDLNDPTKTGLSCMAICNMVDQIRIADISDNEELPNGDAASGRTVRRVPRVKVEDDPNDPVGQDLEELTEEEVESRLRMSTGAFREWMHEFLGRVLLLFANLPEEGGKTGRAGGKTEILTLQSVLHTCGAIFGALDEKLFDAALDQVAEYATTTTKSNAVDAVGELVKNLSAVNAAKTFEKFFPICRQRISSELRAGASSTRTTTTSIPRPSDAPLHWWMSILYGLLVPGRLNLPKYRTEYMELLRTMLQHTYSERGWAWAGNIIEKTLSCLTALYLEEMNLLNAADRDSEDFKKNHTMWWGKLYRPAQVKPQWKRPTDADVDMALEVVGLADEAVTTINGLLDNSNHDVVWTNDFCRAMNVVDEVLLGSYSLVAEYEDLKNNGKPSDTYMPEELMKPLPPYKAGFVLSDPKDSRYQRVKEFRKRAGDMLHRASAMMRTAGDDNSVDSVKLLVATIGSYLVSYGMRAKKYQSASSAFDNLQASKRMYEGQRKQHRSVLLGAAQVHHSNRLMTASYARARSAEDDALVMDMLEFCLSPFLRVRRRAQSLLSSISKTYRDASMLYMDTLLDSLKPGTDPDRMKGALYVLRVNVIGSARLTRDWRGLSSLIDALLAAHHENKTSIQTLVNKSIEELLGKIREPVTFRLEYKVENTDKAADALANQLTIVKPDPEFIGRIVEGEERRLQHQDEEYDTIVDHVRAKAQDTTLNWRYQQAAARFLFVMTRRDRPTDRRLLEYFLNNIQNPHPRIRDFASGGLTRMLFQATLRTFTQGSMERLFLQEPKDPFASKIDLTKQDAGFTERYLKAFREEPTEDSVLQDRIDTGWLAWGREMEVTRFAKWDEQVFHLEEACKPAIDIVVAAVEKDEWWQKLAEFWSQEETRNYPSANHIDLILALCQIVGLPILEKIKPVVDKLMADMDEKKVYDRHQTRAVWEFLAGLLRGTWEWPGKDRQQFWEWFTPLLPKLFHNIRQDTVKCWDITVEYVLHEQDPRRYKPLVDFMLSTALSADFQGGSAFDLSRRVQLSRSVLRCLRWRFSAWSPEFEKLYFSALSCPYADVRALMGSVLNGLDQLHWNASYPSVHALVDAVLGDPECEIDIMGIRNPHLQPELNEAMAKLKELRAERPSGPKAAMSAHDTTAITLMHWLGIELSDVHAVGTFPYLIPILPDIFELREMNDNTEMQAIAGRLLAWITSITPAFQLIEPLIEQLISILQNSEVS